MRSQYSLEEQETTINVFPRGISDQAEVYTCIPSMVQRLTKLHKNHPDEMSVIYKDGCAHATVPRGWIKIQPKRKCTLTAEQKAANAARLAAVRKEKSEVVQT